MATTKQLKTLHYIGDDLQEARKNLDRVIHTLKFEAPWCYSYTSNGDRPSLLAIQMVEHELIQALDLVRGVLQETEDVP